MDRRAFKHPADHQDGRGLIFAETERLRLRTWEEADLAPFAEHCNTPAIMRWTGEVQDEAGIRAGFDRVSACQAEYGHCLWIVERKSDRALLGFCGIKRVDRRGVEYARRVRDRLAIARGCVGPGLCPRSRDSEPRCGVRPVRRAACHCLYGHPERSELGTDGAAGHDPPRRPRFLRSHVIRPSSTRRSSIASTPRTGRRRAPSRPRRAWRSSINAAWRWSIAPASLAAASIAAKLAGAIPPARHQSLGGNRVDVAERARSAAARRDQRRQGLLRGDPAFARRIACRRRQAARLRLAAATKAWLPARTSSSRSSEPRLERRIDRARRAARSGSARADRSLRRRAGRATASDRTAPSKRPSPAAGGGSAVALSSSV